MKGLIADRPQVVRLLHRQRTRWHEAMVYEARASKDHPLLKIKFMMRWFEKQHEYYNKIREEMNMPKKDFTEREWKGFINVNLTTEHKEAYGAWDLHDGDVIDAIASFVEGGYKMSLMYRGDQGTFVCTFTGTAEAGKNSGYAVSSYAKDLYNAMRLALYKVSVILPPVWGDYAPTPLDDIG